MVIMQGDILGKHMLFALCTPLGLVLFADAVIMRFDFDEDHGFF
jgi:hypothetical protein